MGARPAVSAPVEGESPGELKRLTSLRAIAALLVFAYHIGHHSTWFGGSWFRNGFVGVAFFFVLSGFVLTWSTRPGASARRFWVRRWARIYPSHFVMALVAIIVPVTAFPITWPALAANLTLTQAWFPQWGIAFGVNAVSWSLSCEAFFYLVAPFLIRWTHERRLRHVAPVCAAWALAMAGAAIAAGLASNHADIWAYTNPLIRSGEFVLGVLLAVLVQRGCRSALPGWLGLVAVVGVAVLVHRWWLPQSVVDVIFIAPFALAIWISAGADLRGVAGVLHHRWATYAGEVSFAFYLVHELVIMNVVAVVGADRRGLSTVPWVLTAFVLSALCAVALHHLVERPAQRWIRERMLRDVRA